MSFHVRGEALVATAVMRSNNALRLLPYNMFELSFIAELAATSLDLALGPYVHIAQSLHVYEDEVAVARALPAARATLRTIPPMPPMPREPASRTRCSTWFASRHCFAQRASRAIKGLAEALLEHASGELHPYWLAFLLVLMHAKGPPEFSANAAEVLKRGTAPPPFPCLSRRASIVIRYARRWRLLVASDQRANVGSD